MNIHLYIPKHTSSRVMAHSAHLLLNAPVYISSGRELQCVAVCCCSVLQCVAVCCCSMSDVARAVAAVWCSVVQCVQLCCSVLQCVVAV